ncbi:MAG: hypothetical protein AB200_00810 [Parcubacteria bacterium C7867-005]|nr:MAG: hypothetical protein AB200_00810 [Parcubacteria bacterium C7867-005]
MNQKQKGIIGKVILIIIALILLKYFLDWSIFDAVSSEQGQETTSYIGRVFNVVWGYISAPVIFIWEKIVWPVFSLVWHTFELFLDWGEKNVTPIQK